MEGGGGGGISGEGLKAIWKKLQNKAKLTSYDI